LERNLLILICISFLLGGDEFILTARTYTKDSVLVYDEISISPSMSKKDGVKLKKCELLADEDFTDTLTFLNERKNEVALCFADESVRFHDFEEHKLNRSFSQTDATLLPVHFTVEFKEDLATLFILKR